MKRLLLVLLVLALTVGLCASCFAAYGSTSKPMAKKPAMGMMGKMSPMMQDATAAEMSQKMAMKHAMMVRRQAGMKKMDWAAMRKNAMAMGEDMRMAKKHQMMMQKHMMKNPKAMMRYKMMMKDQDMAMMQQKAMMKEMGMKKPNAMMVKKQAGMAEGHMNKAMSEHKMMMKMMPY